MPSRATQLGVGVQHDPAGDLIGVREAQPGRPDLGDAEHVALADQRRAAHRVDERRDVGDVGRGRGVGGQHDERAVEPADDALEGVLVRVVPVRADLIGDEPVDERLARRDRVLGHARDAVVARGHVVAVPVQGHPVLDVAVGQRDLDQLALGDDELGTGDRPEGHRVVVGAVRAA